MTRYTPFPQHAWNSKFFALLDAETHYVSRNWSRFVSLVPPPADEQGECDLVVARIGEREGRREEILFEDKGLEAALWPVIRTLAVPGVTAQNWTTSLPCTWMMLLSAFYDLQPGLYVIKQRFSRGRPVHAGGSVIGVTSITTPGHPSYPAGHAAQGHMAVLLLGHLLQEEPSLMQAMLGAAERVAENRVIAGIHFPSDSVAGKNLALQFVPMLLRSELFGNLCADARRELESVRRRA